MTVDEIAELIDVAFDGVQARLARRLQMHESTVSLWLSGDRKPIGPAIVLMRQWLEQARAEAAPKSGRKLAAAK